MSFETILWKDGKTILLNQLLLPHQVEYMTCNTYQEVADAIRNMVVRGAPAIGITAAMGIAQASIEATSTKANFQQEMSVVYEAMKKTRPTAVNLFWAIDRMKRVVEQHLDHGLDQIREALVAEAQIILKEDIEINRKIGEYGAEFVSDGDVILTHCNAGALATGGYGTATAVIRVAHEQGKNITVLADETRPYLQGARLTTWELQQDGIPVELITDNMAGHFLKSGEMNLCVVGTDRTAMNGDVANKIGTYMVAVCAKENNVPFYVAAPTSSIDQKLSDGSQIPIEERSAEEVIRVGEVYISSKDTKARHVAFDVTPARYVTGIITENGVARMPYDESLKKLLS